MTNRMSLRGSGGWRDRVPAAAVVALAIVVVLVIVVAAVLIYPRFVAGPTEQVFNPRAVVVEANGSRFYLPAGGWFISQPLNLTNQTLWYPSGGWWQSNGTTDCIMTAWFHSGWNGSVPSDCDGFTYYGDAGQPGCWWFSGGIALSHGVYYFVWYNLSPTSPTEINVTSTVELYAGGLPGHESAPPAANC